MWLRTGDGHEWSRYRYWLVGTSVTIAPGIILPSVIAVPCYLLVLLPF
jgi:hypothetical protein